MVGEAHEVTCQVLCVAHKVWTLSQDACCGPASSQEGGWICIIAFQVIAFPLHNPCKKSASFSKRGYCFFRPRSAKERVPAPAVFQSK
jgi:hypothetical protein